MKANILELGESGVFDGATTIEREAATNDIIIKTNTTERLRIKENGDIIIDGTTFAVDAANNRVGILTASPTSAFTIGTTLTEIPRYGYLRAYNADRSTNGSISLFDGSGDVNIQTTFGSGDVRLTPGASSGIIDLNGNTVINGSYVTLPGGCRDWGKRAAAPTSPTPVEGDRYWNTTTHAISYYNGSSWS